jgi:hypothetical protein
MVLKWLAYLGIVASVPLGAITAAFIVFPELNKTFRWHLRRANLRI